MIHAEQEIRSRGMAELLEELNTLLAGPVDAASFEVARARLVEEVCALQERLKVPPLTLDIHLDQAASPDSVPGHLDPGLPGQAEALAALETALQTGEMNYVAPVWVERMQLVQSRYGHNVAEQVMQVCSQQVISRILRAHDQLFYWGGAGLVGVLRRDGDLSGVRSELMRVLATPVNQYFETEHRTIYLPIRMSGELFSVKGSIECVQEQLQTYFSRRS